MGEVIMEVYEYSVKEGGILFENISNCLMNLLF